MVYKQIKPKKIYEEVADALLETIKAGTIMPGEKLDSVQQLAENFQVGRSAIREALSALRAMGIVEMKQGEGTFVKYFNPDLIASSVSSAILMNKKDIVHLLEVRKILEAGAAGSAALNRTQGNIEKFEGILDRMKDSVGNEELGEKSDLDFHMAIAEASQNSLLLRLMDNVSGMMIETMRETRRIWLYSKHKTAERLYQEHVTIFKAILQKDSVSAQNLMLEHLESVEQVLLKYLGQ
ncbi:FadR/GntR family transcriptional regulator [Metabacillus sp. RGM 3146]|uniref:FadR/GntR family transcriptional regulator n=1 Tax=Metabacillus sp. RGM 3146 TaxID=3401092 RepID=UPI003B9CDEB9